MYDLNLSVRFAHPTYPVLTLFHYLSPELLHKRCIAFSLVSSYSVFFRSRTIYPIKNSSRNCLYLSVRFFFFWVKRLMPRISAASRCKVLSCLINNVSPAYNLTLSPLSDSQARPTASLSFCPYFLSPTFICIDYELSLLYL